MRQLFLVLLSSAAIALNLSNRNEKQCVQNLRDIATGLEMHSCPTGRYPLKMGAVVTSGCLKSVPTCPAAGCDTYSVSYQSTARPDTFTLYCQGYHHGSIRLLYTAEEGLIRQPAA